MKYFDVIVIGGGVAGLSSALYAARAGSSVCIFDNSGGGQLGQIDALENYPGLYPAVNGSVLLETLMLQVKAFKAQIEFSSIKSIEKKGALFEVVSTSTQFTMLENYTSKAVIIATGATHSALGVPGEKEFIGKGVSYCAVCDGPFFRNKDVAVIGGGDAACTEALYLSNIAANVHLIHRRDLFRAQKILADKVFANQKVKVHFNSIVKKINGDTSVRSVLLEDTLNKKTLQLNVSGVFIFVGMNASTELIENVQKDERGYVVTDEKMQTAVPGLFCAGDVRSKPLRQIVTAANDGAIAGFFAAEYAKRKS